MPFITTCDGTEIYYKDWGKGWLGTTQAVPDSGREAQRICLRPLPASLLRLAPTEGIWHDFG